MTTATIDKAKENSTELNITWNVKYDNNIIEKSTAVTENTRYFLEWDRHSKYT